ncbi:MAG: glucose 1-dehydrogenase [Gemmatimonadota bacterium]
MYDLNGKVALVTGAGGQRGIGRAVARRLAAEGADLVVADVTDRGSGEWGGLPAVAVEIAASGRRSLAVVADVCEAASVDRMMEEALAAFGRVDIVVNNAGAAAGPDRVPVADLPESEWDRIQRVNARGVFLCCRAAARHMRARPGGGRIINMASLAGQQGLARYGAYCASKFAVIGLTQVLALELAPHQVTVNAVCPGLVETERVTGMAEGLKPPGVSTEAYRQELIVQNAAKTALGRIAQPEDVARTVAFLASDEAAYLTGLSVSVSGGARMG